MSQPALLIIDAQKGIDETVHWGGNRNNPEAENRILELLALWRKNQWPVCHINHDSVDPGSPFYPEKEGNQIKTGFAPLPHEPVFRKSVTSAFVGTALGLFLSRKRLSTLIITGFVTQNSVEATARTAGDMGYEVFVVSDAVATFDKTGVDGVVYPSMLIHTVALSNLQGEYATILSTQELISRFL